MFLQQAVSHACRIPYSLHCNFCSARSVEVGFTQLLAGTDLAVDRQLISAQISVL